MQKFRKDWRTRAEEDDHIINIYSFCQVCIEPNQIPRPEGRGMLFSRCGCTQGFNIFLTALKGGVLNPFGTNKKQCNGHGNYQGNVIP